MALHSLNSFHALLTEGKNTQIFNIKLSGLKRLNIIPLSSSVKDSKLESVFDTYKKKICEKLFSEGSS